jgi:hypothetical protein
MVATMSRSVRGLVVGIAVVGAACGRIGYEVLGDDDPTDPDADPGTPGADADTRPWTVAACGEAVRIADVGDSVVSPGYLLDVAPTAAGFVVAWSAGPGAVHAAGFELDPAGRVLALDGGGAVDAINATGLSIASIGDAVMLGVGYDNTAINVYPLDHLGHQRSGTKTIDGHVASGHDFVVADAAASQFVVMGIAPGSGSDATVDAFVRDLDGHPDAEVIPSALDQSTEATAAVIDGGYALLYSETLSTKCLLAPVGADGVGLGSSQLIDMTCKNATLTHPPDSTALLAAWNCTNDAVWLARSDAAGAWSEPRAVYQGDAASSASDPRVSARTSDLWYAFRVASDRLGRGIISPNATDDVLLPDVVYSSSRLRAYDLVSSPTDDAYLVWLETENRDELWAMRLCGP